MSDATPREWRFYVDDMIGFAENIHSYTGHLEKPRVCHSGERRNPEKSTTWTPAFAGVTGYSSCPTEGLDQAGFTASGLNYDATVRNLELIGEAATHIPEEIRKDNAQIPWRLIIALRNRLSG